MKKKEMKKKICSLEDQTAKLEKSMELAMPLLSVLMDHIDMKRHARMLTVEEILERGGIDAMLSEEKREIEEIEKCVEQEGIDYQQAVFRHRYKKRQQEYRENIKELENIWEV